MPAFRSVLSRLTMGLTALFVICACGRQGGSPIEGDGGKFDLVPSQTQQTRPPAPRPARADGTIDGGGGPYKAESKVEDEHIVHALYMAKILIPYLLNFWEANWYGLNWGVSYGPDGHVVPTKILEKFFPPAESGKKDVFQRFSEMKLVPSDQPCYDKFKNPIAASSWPYESNEICFSLPLIRANATTANLYNRILAYVFHEMIHKMGFEDEEETQRIERYVIYRFLPTDVLEYTRERLSGLFSHTFRDPSKVHGFKGVQGTIEQLEKKLQVEGDPDWSSICLDIGNVSLSSGFSSDSPIAGMRAAMQGRIYIANEKSRMLDKYCRQDSEERKWTDLSFENSPDKNMITNEIRRFERDKKPPAFMTYTIRRPIRHHRENLLAELKEIRETADAVNAELAKLPPEMKGYRHSILEIVPQ